MEFMSYLSESSLLAELPDLPSIRDITFSNDFRFSFSSSKILRNFKIRTVSVALGVDESRQEIKSKLVPIIDL